MRRAAAMIVVILSLALPATVFALAMESLAMPPKSSSPNEHPQHISSRDRAHRKRQGRARHAGADQEHLDPQRNRDVENIALMSFRRHASVRLARRLRVNYSLSDT